MGCVTMEFAVVTISGTDRTVLCARASPIALFMGNASMELVIVITVGKVRLVRPLTAILPAFMESATRLASVFATLALMASLVKTRCV